MKGNLCQSQDSAFIPVSSLVDWEFDCLHLKLRGFSLPFHMLLTSLSFKE